MKPKDKVLTYEQARELKWFCKNVAGTRMEFYAALEKIQPFKDKIDRLQETADLILKWCEENNIQMFGEEPKPQAEHEGS